eukprot:m.154614 g.154614  ORF g.154614 m.154614 type:complete len:499 (+) comp30898_c0_seq1:235-1731(+)
MSDDFPELGKVDPDAAPDKKQVSTAGLLLIAFFWVCGGIYGNETLVQTGPPAYMFLMLFGTAIFYALPMSLISAELATALPYDGGLVAWVEETCGKRIGFHNMYWLWISYLFDAAAYPLLAAAYIAKQFDLAKITGDAELGKVIVAEGIIALITLIKLGGTDYIVKASGAFFVLSMLPTVLFTVYASKDMKPETWIDTDVSDPAGFQVTLLVSWVTWLFCGFNSLGALAGEIKDPKKTYPIVMAILIPVSTLTIAWPVAVSLSIDSNRSHYDVGYFNELAARELGAWIGYAFVVGAIFAFVGLYNAQIMVCERSLAAFGEDEMIAYLDRKKRSAVTRYLFTENGTGVAPIYIVVNAVLAGVLLLLPYTVLVEFAMLQMCLNMNLFLYAFIWYKWCRPDMVRPLKMPGGVCGSIILSFPVFCISCLTFYLGVSDDEVVIGFPYGKACGFGLVVVFGILLDLLGVLIGRCTNTKDYIDDDDDYHLKTPLITNNNRKTGVN